ncbi:MAG: hypothetical protein ACREBC_22725 [Pyrinomonadaceae bacterium]
MPNVWIFQILFPLLSPVLDLMLVWTLVSAALERLEHPAEYVTTNLGTSSFITQSSSRWTGSLPLLPCCLRSASVGVFFGGYFCSGFCYRQLMYYVMIRSIIGATRGTLIGWGKLERKATAQAHP